MKAFCGVWLPTLLAFLAIHCCYAKEWKEYNDDEKLTRVLEIMWKINQGDATGGTTMAEISSILNDKLSFFKGINLGEFFATSLLQGRFNQTDSQGRNLILNAFNYKLNLKGIKLLVKLGADLHHLDIKGQNIFLQLISGGVEITPPILKYLLSEGVSPFLASKESKTLLSEVIITKNKGLIQALLDSGMDINAKDDVGHTLLQYLVFLSSKEGPQSVQEAKPLMTYLIEKGANVNFVDEKHEQYSLLHFAGMHGSVEMMKFLLEKGANANVLNKEGLTPAQTIFFWNGPFECEDNGAICSRKSFMVVGYTPDITLFKTGKLYDNEELAREDLKKILESIQITGNEDRLAQVSEIMDQIRKSDKILEEMELRMKETERHQQKINRFLQTVESLKTFDFKNEL